MTKEAIRDNMNRPLGYIEKMSDGRLRALDTMNRPLGYYDPKRDVTLDTMNRPLNRGNTLAALVVGSKK